VDDCMPQMMFATSFDLVMNIALLFHLFPRAPPSAVAVFVAFKNFFRSSRGIAGEKVRYR